MNVRRLIQFGVFVVFAYGNVGLQAQSPVRVPIWIDTDIGADIGDAFSLGLAFGSHELDVQGITTVGDDAQQKAMMMCRFLTVTGRRHTAVAAGNKPQPSRPITDQYQYYNHPDVLFDRTKKPERASAVDFLAQRLQASPKATLVALGPLTNIARLLESEADARSRIERIVLLESNLTHDIPAAQSVFASGVPLVVITAEACEGLQLSAREVERVFSPGSPLTRQIQTLYQLWDRPNPPLADSLAVATCFDERFVKSEQKSVAVDAKGMLKTSKGQANASVIGSVDAAAFAGWYAARMASLVPPTRRPVKLIEQGAMPLRVHVAEDFDTDIERRWWMSGKPENHVLPFDSQRACRGVLTHDFDDLLMVSREMYSAVIFNPVPGPPMGKNTRLSFRYWIAGTDTLRVQIYSLTNGYHRQLVVRGLPQRKWRQATVDMTQARRPDGTGGPLSEGERIDDIQFYADADAEIVIDDIVLYDVARDGETRPFPKRILFTGWFDTGAHGREWPGDFKLVADAGNFSRAAQSVINPTTGKPWLRLGLRGERTLGDVAALSFRYRLTGADAIEIRLVNSTTGSNQFATLKGLSQNQWDSATVNLDTNELRSADEIHIFIPSDGDVLIDDVLLFEPETARVR